MPFFLIIFVLNGVILHCFIAENLKNQEHEELETLDARAGAARCIGILQEIDPQGGDRGEGDSRNAVVWRCRQ